MQNRAARVITDISYENADHERLLKDLNILNVGQLVERDTGFLMYRVENDLILVHVKSMFTKCSEIHAYNTRTTNAGNYVTTKIRTEKGKQALHRLVLKYGMNRWTSPEGFSQLKFFKKKMRKNHFR